MLKEPFGKPALVMMAPRAVRLLACQSAPTGTAPAAVPGPDVSVPAAAAPAAVMAEFHQSGNNSNMREACALWDIEAGERGSWQVPNLECTPFAACSPGGTLPVLHSNYISLPSWCVTR